MADSPAWLLLLTGGGLAIVGTVAGAVVNQVGAVRLAKAARQSSRVDQLRTTIVDLVVDGRAYIDTMWTMLPAFHKSGLELMMSFPDTDSGKEHSARISRLHRLTTEARLHAEDPRLRGSVAAFSLAFITAPDKIVGPVISSGGRVAQFQDLLDSLGKLNELQALLVDIEQRMAELAMPPSPRSAQRMWQFLRRLQPRQRRSSNAS